LFLIQGVGKQHNHKLHKGIPGKPENFFFPLQLDVMGYLLTFQVRDFRKLLN